MGLLQPVIPDRRALLQDIEGFRSFLSGSPRAERAEFLPFFGAHAQLCAFLATFNNAVRRPDHVAYEFPLWGDFVCDVVAGSRRDGAFVFIEFEDAAETSLFRSVRGRKVSRGAGGSRRASRRSPTGCSASTARATPTRWNGSSATARSAHSDSSLPVGGPRSAPMTLLG